GSYYGFYASAGGCMALIGNLLIGFILGDAGSRPRHRHLVAAGPRRPAGGVWIPGRIMASAGERTEQGCEDMADTFQAG
ncbi:hypothetical protein ACSZNZ_20740, partial [Aeromonas caviae]|uniref:hypothetical protein n=1 Tax=Aeromonas caviae TaxID=648 RepID=UPI003EC6EDD0